MSEYNVKFTDASKTPITIAESEINDGSVKAGDDLDIALFGRIRLEYGQRLNENLLNILENFACPGWAFSGGDADAIYPAQPNPAYTTNLLLTHPTEGQFWFNTSNQHMYVRANDDWIPLSNRGDYAANWGQVVHGQALPKPVSAYTGYEFDYDECIWNVSPAYITGSIDGMICTTNNNAVVSMQFLHTGSILPTPGVANYLIVGVRGDKKTPDFSQNPAVYRLSVNTTMVNEGQAFIVTLVTLGLPSGTQVPYTISGSVTSSDFGIWPNPTGGSSSGNFVINSQGYATLFILTNNDAIADGIDNFVLSLNNGQATPVSVTILDTGVPTPTYALATNKASILEGDSWSVTLTTQYASPGTLVPYTITGVTSADLNGAPLTGNFTVDGDGITSINFTSAANVATPKTFTLTLNNGLGVPNFVNTVINENPAGANYALSASASSVYETQSFTVSLITSGVPAGTSVSYTITGVSSFDISGASLTGSFIVHSSGVTTKSFTTAHDMSVENETFTLTLDNGLGTPNFVNVTIVDNGAVCNFVLGGGGPLIANASQRKLQLTVYNSAPGVVSAPVKFTPPWPYGSVGPIILTPTGSPNTKYGEVTFAPSFGVNSTENYTISIESPCNESIEITLTGNDPLGCVPDVLTCCLLGGQAVGAGGWAWHCDEDINGNPIGAAYLCTADDELAEPAKMVREPSGDWDSNSVWVMENC